MQDGIRFGQITCGLNSVGIQRIRLRRVMPGECLAVLADDLRNMTVAPYL